MIHPQITQNHSIIKKNATTPLLGCLCCKRRVLYKGKRYHHRTSSLSLANCSHSSEAAWHREVETPCGRVSGRTDGPSYQAELFLRPASNRTQHTRLALHRAANAATAATSVRRVRGPRETVRKPELCSLGDHRPSHKHQAFGRTVQGTSRK